jgi:hypothetical protein
MNDIDGSDRHLKTEDGQTACGLFQASATDHE